MANIKQAGEFKVGQEVVVYNTYCGHTTKSIKKIDKITDGYGGSIYIKGSRYSVDGILQSRGWSVGKIKPVTDKDREAIKKQRAKSIIATTNFGKMNGDLAFKTIAFLKENGFDPMENRKQ